MFVYKNRLLIVKKVTFGNVEKVLFWVMALLPERKGQVLNFKLKNKKLFRRAVREIAAILIDNCPRIWTVKQMMFVLQHIITETRLELILERYQKTMEEESKETVHKSDYMQRFMSDVRRAIMPYQSLTYEEMNQIGFLELEEYVAELQKREIRRQQTLMNNLLMVVGCVLSKKGGKDFEKVMRDLNKAYRELDNIGFDELNYMPDLMGAKYGKQV